LGKRPDFVGENMAGFDYFQLENGCLKAARRIVGLWELPRNKKPREG
jgi:hypothetical protein